MFIGDQMILHDITLATEAGTCASRVPRPLRNEAACGTAFTFHIDL